MEKIVFHAKDKKWNIIKNIKHIDFYSDWRVTVNNWIEVISLKQVYTKDELIATRKTIPPKLEWIKSYCNMRNNNIDSQEFFDYYESVGWLRGKTKIKDWQWTIRTREKNDKNNTNTQTKVNRENKRDTSKIYERLNN